MSLGELPLALQCDLPDWLIDRLLPRLGATALLALARSLNEPAPLDLRVNRMKATREAVLARFVQEGIVARATPYSPLGGRREEEAAIIRHELLRSGKPEVQDDGSQLLALLTDARRGEMVVDFCAGAGGKTLLLGDLMHSQGRLYAFDASARRLANLKPRLARAGLTNVEPRGMADEHDPRVLRLADKADRVLVDAPCSGLGTLRRNPDLKWRQTPAAVAEMTVKQASILAAAARLVRPGGRLVYGTCSLLVEENEEIVQGFLDTHPDFLLLPAAQVLAQAHVPLDTGPFLALTPAAHGCDGFFAAVLERRAPATG
jgi:16S rRNA (cytosine967-C5)-methyltransferase